MINSLQLTNIMPRGADKVAAYMPFMNELLDRYEINTPLREAAFLAQIAHESVELTKVVENLNYSADGLAGTWPSRFRNPDGSRNAKALELHRRPLAIANFVYANRMGNGSEASGDGWNYRGRGLIQITGKENYARVALALGIDCIVHPELLEQPQYALESACWFWMVHGLNDLADIEDMTAITRKINGGINGLNERLSYYARARKALGIE